MEKPTFAFGHCDRRWSPTGRAESGLRLRGKAHAGVLISDYEVITDAGCRRRSSSEKRRTVEETLFYLLDAGPNEQVVQYVGGVIAQMTTVSRLVRLA